MTILIAYKRFPDPDTNSGSLRLVELITILRECGYRVVFVAQTDNGQRYRDALVKLGVSCVSDDCGRLSSDAEALRDLLAAHDVRLAIFSHFEIYAAYASRVQELSPRVHCVLDTVDLHHVRLLRAATLTGDERAMREAMDTKRRELAMIRDADSVWVVTGEEQAILKSALGRQCPPVHIVPNIHRVGLASPPFSQRSGIVFLGGYRHDPNVDAVRYFLLDVLPHVRSVLPDIAVTIAGSHPPDEFKRYESEFPGVHVTGFVEDHRAVLCSHRVGIAPLRYGAGMKGKVGEYLSCGLPVVTTSVGAEGMGLEHGRDALIADDARGFAESVARLYQDEKLWAELSRRGMECVVRNWSPDALRRTVGEVIASAGQRPAGLCVLKRKARNVMRLPRAAYREVRRSFSRRSKHSIHSPGKENSQL